MNFFNVDPSTALLGGIDHGLSIVSHVAVSLWSQSPAIVLIGGFLMLVGVSLGGGGARE